MAKTQDNPFAGDVLACQAIWKVIWPAVGDDHELATFLTNRAYVRGIPLNDLRGKRRDALKTRILNVSPSEDGRETVTFKRVQKRPEASRSAR